MECGTRATVGCGRATRLNKRAALLALVVRVADGSEVCPLVEAGVRTSIGGWYRVALNDGRAFLALVVIHGRWLSVSDLVCASNG